MKKKILIVHTGGTIAMSEDEATGAIRQEKNNPLHNTVESLTGLATIIEDDYLHLPSPHITPDHMFNLVTHINNRTQSDQVNGVVITHGTDTLEETAYLLDLLLDAKIPVIITGAMRSSNELGSDGPHNLITSVKVALDEEASGKGVLVVFNDEIHTAKNVTKTHTSNVSTFQSPQYGPIGIVTKRGVFFHHVPAGRDHYSIKQLSKKVIVLKAYAGMDRELIQAIGQLNVDGLVIEALGQGNLPPAVVPDLKNLLAQNILIVLVSRSFNGIVQDTYGYEGGGKQLKELGIIFSNGLNGQKARLKLMVTLELTNDHTKLQELFLK